MIGSKGQSVANEEVLFGALSAALDSVSDLLSTVGMESYSVSDEDEMVLRLNPDLAQSVYMAQDEVMASKRALIDSLVQSEDALLRQSREIASREALRDDVPGQNN